MQTLCEPCELCGLSVAGVLLPLWDSGFYYGVFYCCWSKDDMEEAAIK